MKLTKVRSILLVSIMMIALSIFSGCGSNKAATTPDSQPKPNPSSSPASAPVEPAGNNQVKDEKDEVIELISKGSQVNEMYYELIMIGPGYSSESKSWLKGSKMKIDTTMNGQRLISVFDLPNEVITYMPGENLAMKADVTEYQGHDNVTPIDYIKQLNKNDLNIIGSEKINGLECQVIQFASGSSLFKQWISLDHGIVVKIEEIHAGETTVLEFKNLKVGSGSVSDDVFTLPQGLEVIDMNEMMQNFPDTASP